MKALGDGTLLLEVMPSIEEVIKKPKVRLSIDEIEELSVKAQKEAVWLIDVLLDTTYLLPVFDVGIDIKHYEKIFHISKIKSKCFIAPYPSLRRNS